MTNPTKPRRALRIKHILERFGFSRSLLYKEIKAGTFPPGQRVAKNIRVWWDDEIDAEMERRLKLFNDQAA